MLKCQSLEKASTDRIGMIRNRDARYLTQVSCMEESVSSLMNMTLSTDKFADESTTERSQSPGDMSEA